MKTLLAFGAALAIATPALAQEIDTDAIVNPTRNVVVAYNPAGLENDRDARVLLDRLSEASAEACGADRASLREYRLAIGRSVCFRNTLDRAVASVGSPNLDRLHAYRGALLVASR